MRNAMHKIRLLSSELKKSTERFETAEKQLQQNDTDASDMATLNSEETTRLTEQVRMESAKREDEASALQQETNELHRLQMTFDEVVQEKQRLGKQIRQLKFDAESAANEIESKKQGNLERTARIRTEESAKDIMSSRLNDKTDACEEGRSNLVDLKTRASMLKDELRDAEKRENDLNSEMIQERSEIADLELEIRTLEDRHVADAQNIKLKIGKLQDALHEKISTVDMLVRASVKIRAKAKELQERLNQAEDEAAQAKQIFESMIDGEKTKVGNLRAELERLTREATHVRSSELNQSERLVNIESKMNEVRSESEALMHEVSQKRRQAHRAQVEAQRLGAKERDMMDSIKDLEETITELRLQERNEERNEAHLLRQLKELQTESKYLAHKVSEKNKIDRVLAAKVEAERLHVTEIRGDTQSKVMTHKRAENEMRELVHQLTDEPI